MNEFIGVVAPSIVSGAVSGVIVSLVTLRLAGRQRARREKQAEAKRRETILAGIGRALQWNRTATRSELDASDAHCMIGSLATVAFERHGFELAAIAPDSVELVFRHCAAVGTAREGIRTVAGPPGRDADEALRLQWIELSAQARTGVSNSATEALKSLGLPLEPQDGIG